MSGIFISHSSRDNAVADEVSDRLQQQGYQSLFLDFDPADGIPAGRDWEREIYAKLRACSGVILLCSEHSMASDWCFAEITHARALGKHLFPVVVSACTLRPILLDTQVTDLTGDREEGYQRLWRGLLKAGLDPADFFKWDETRPPYPGLVPFAAEDAAVYCGRDDDRRRCLDALEQMKRYGGEGLLILVGTSGSGKSSLVRAGVIPRLERMAEWWVLPPMRPREKPVEELGRVLALAFDQVSQPVDGHRIATDLIARDDDRGLAAVLDGLRTASERRDRAVLLVVDQLEELVTTSDEAAARRFVALLRAAMADAAGRLFCLATLRSDYLAALQVSALWQHTGFREISLGPLTPAHFTEIITRPAVIAGIELEPGLVETMVQDTGTADALPLLSFTLNRLWRDYGTDGKLTLEEYRDRVGGLEGSIRHEAEAVLATLNPGPAQLDALRRAFRGMVHIDAQGQYTRRPMRWSELPASIHPIMEAFVSARLLVSGREESAGTAAAAEPETDRRTLEVAHEALFRAWDKLRGWLHEDRTFLLWLQHASAEAEAWRRNPQDAGLLLRGGPLTEAERWLRQRGAEIGAPLRAYVAASGRVTRRTRLVLRTLQVLIAVSLVAVSWLALEFRQERAAALRQLVDSYWSIGIAARDAEAEKNPVKAAHYFAQVADLATHADERSNALVSIGMLTGGLELRAMLKLPGVPRGLWAGAGGSTVAYWSGTQAQLLDLATGKTVARAEHRGDVRTAAYTGEGLLVSLSDDGRVKVTGTSAPARELPQTGVRGMAMDDAGTRLLTWGGDGPLRLWQLPAADAPERLDLGQPVAGALFLAAPDTVLAWGREGAIRVWQPARDASSGWEAGCRPQGVAVSAGGAILATWCDKTLSLHDLGDGRLLRSWDSPDWVDGAAFAPALSAIVTWDNGSGLVRVWDARDGSPLADEVIAHGRALTRVRLTPDGRRLVTSGADGRIRLWDLTRRTQQEMARAAHDADLSRVDVRLSADGTRTLSWSEDAGARLWDTATMTPLSLPLLHRDATQGALFYESDRGIVTWGGDATLRVWRRTPDREATAPATLPPPGAAAAGSAACAAEALDEEVRRGVTAWIQAAGLGGYEPLDRCDDDVLIASGPEARLITLGEAAYAAPPRIRLGEDIRGAALQGQGRVALWGTYSLRLWDGRTGRPLSAHLTSDVVGPTVAKRPEGLLTWDAVAARYWRWPLPQTGDDAAHWLRRVSATRLDTEHLVQTVMDHADWCAAAGETAPPPGCGP